MRSFVILFALVLSASAFAQKRIVSVDAFDLAYSGGLLFKSDEGKGRNADRDENTLRFNLNYAEQLAQYPQLMWKAQFHWNRTETDYGGDTLVNQFGVAGGVLVNLDDSDVKNSLFGGVQVGLERMTIEVEPKKDKSAFNLLLELEGGKRWDLGQYSVANISYAPTISLLFRRYGGGLRDDYFTNGHEIKLNFLKFDVLF